MAHNLREVIEQVRSLTDIVELIGSYLPLKRSGQGFKACCPFHDEKTPSFNVSPARQFFHCFGCGEKGGAFDFVMKMDRVEFREALEILAERVHVRIDVDRGGGEDQDRTALYRIHEWTQSWFRRSMASPEGRACRDYVEGRKITPAMAEAFGLGFAPEGWTGLVGRAGDAGYPAQLLEKGGLALRGTTRPGFYDRFRNRLTFPIRDTVGRVVAFGARSLDGSEPKYLNSPETPIFVKGRTLFGLDRLKQHRREDPVLVMEGYTDVLMSAQVGVKGAVATLGTAMTPEHARILSRYSERTVLVYDGDAPGLVAAERGAMILLRAGHLDIKVAVLPGGQDPCDFFVARGVAGVEDLLDVTVDLVSFLLDRASIHHDLESLEGRRRAAEDLVRAAGDVADPVAREMILFRVAERLRIPLPALKDRIDAIHARQASRPARGPRPGEAPAGESRPPGPGDEAGRESRLKSDGQAQLWVIQCLLNAAETHDAVDAADLAWIPDPRVRRLAGNLLAAVARARDLGVPPPPAGILLDTLDEPMDKDLARRALFDPGPGTDFRTRLDEAVRHLKNRNRRQEVEQLKNRVEDGDADLLRDIHEKYRALKRPPGAGSGNLPAAGGAPAEEATN